MSGFRFSLRVASVPVALFLAAPWLLSPARAFGLTGPFQLDNWDLLFSAGDPLVGLPALTKPNPTYQCPSFGTTACVDGPDTENPSSIQESPTGGFTVVGATSADYGDYTGQLFDTAWVLDPGKSGRTTNYQLSFDFLYGSTDVPEAILGYFSINGEITLIQSSTDGQTASGLFTIAPTDTIAFGVRSSILDENFGTVNITNFSAANADVPAPLPLLGAGAAFGWSRRLKQRIRAQAGVTTS